MGLAGSSAANPSLICHLYRQAVPGCTCHGEIPEQVRLHGWPIWSQHEKSTWPKPALGLKKLKIVLVLPARGAFSLQQSAEFTNHRDLPNYSFISDYFLYLLLLVVPFSDSIWHRTLPVPKINSTYITKRSQGDFAMQIHFPEEMKRKIHETIKKKISYNKCWSQIWLKNH